MYNCGSHVKLADPRGQVTIATFTSDETSVHEPLNQGIIFAVKWYYRSTLPRKMHETADIRGRLTEIITGRLSGKNVISECHLSHVLYAAEIFHKCWKRVPETTIPCSWAHAEFMPAEFQRKLRDDGAVPWAYVDKLLREIQALCSADDNASIKRPALSLVQ